ncbi:MAG TPA: hypothetical protein VFA74_02085 [Terriglobales bacterium]|nr:hypothetical protein [Terriglobales bacterium]
MSILNLAYLFSISPDPTSSAPTHAILLREPPEDDDDGEDEEEDKDDEGDEEEDEEEGDEGDGYSE